MNETAAESEGRSESITAAKILWNRIGRIRSRPPVAELRAARQHREALIPLMLDTLTGIASDPAGSVADRDLTAFEAALLLLAEFREPRAFPLILGFFSKWKPDEVESECDLLVDELPTLLASTWDRDLSRLRLFFEDDGVEEEVSGSAIWAAASLVVHGLLPRAELSAWLGELFARAPKLTPWKWGDIVAVAGQLRFEEYRETTNKAFDDGLVDSRHSTRDDVLDAFSEDVDLPACQSYRLVVDAGREATHFPWFGSEDEDDFENFLGDDSLDAAKGFDSDDPPAIPIEAPFVRESPKVGRNDACPCGSGKKHKKCCGA